MQANQSIERAMALLREIGQPSGRASVSQLADVIRVSDATASRMLATLEREGFIERLPGGTFELGPELARLGRLANQNALLLSGPHVP